MSFPSLIHTVTDAVQGAWTLLATHPEITVPGIVALLGTTALVSRRNRRAER